MATAVIYATKHGSTEKAAKLLAENIKDAKAFNIYNDKFDLSGFDAVIIGSFVKMGVFDKKIRKFVLKYFNVLMSKKTGLFMCGIMPENEDAYWRNNYPPQLLEKSLKAHFGGEMDIDALFGMDRKIANMVIRENGTKGVFRKYTINETAIKDFGKRFENNGLS